MPFVILISLILFIIGYAISSRYYGNPIERIVIGLAIGACLCVVAVGVSFAGCALIWKGF